MHIYEFPDADSWERWLEAHRTAQPEAWLRIAKRGSELALPNITEALDVALCHGWIDGQRRGHDDASFLQRYSPRRVRSSWSRVNVAKVEALEVSGRMRPGGTAEVEAAKADGRWAAAYESQRTALVPPDLEAALAGSDTARAAFQRLGRSERYTLMLPIFKAHSSTSRAKVVKRVMTQLTTQERGD